MKILLKKTTYWNDWSKTWKWNSLQKIKSVQKYEGFFSFVSEHFRNVYIKCPVDGDIIPVIVQLNVA